MSEWISVNDRLPELKETVLVYAVCVLEEFKNNSTIDITCMSGRNRPYWENPRPFFHKNYEITHWMPLPEAPRETEKVYIVFGNTARSDGSNIEGVFETQEAVDEYIDMRVRHGDASDDFHTELHEVER